MNFYTPVLNTKAQNFSDFSNMWNNTRVISTLTSPSQITSVGVWRIVSVSSVVNDNLDDDIYAFEDYTSGDLHSLIFDFNGNDTDGCVYGTLLIFSPRWNGKFWTGRIWDGKFTRWYKYEAV